MEELYYAGDYAGHRRCRSDYAYDTILHAGGYPSGLYPYRSLLGGATLTETVFAWPGVGRIVVDSIKSKDTPMVLGAIVLLTITFSVVNLAVDILYAFIDPRIKAQYKRK